MFGQADITQAQLTAISESDPGQMVITYQEGPTYVSS